ncbi:beta-alanine-activating enzyme isoform X1 [Carcharodon carcharias]|uniref:beta-alanine-activating enzyme isoform X1 n=1 Tax=Carcharodon carcharias TaxID=13397 RepID=UPI001B7F32D3|nr:beta-alanine-activating enzyme isoform X1 [Carcharodon carcharias]
MMSKAAADIADEEARACGRMLPKEEECAAAGRLHELVLRAAAVHGARPAVCWESEAEGGSLCYSYSQITSLGNTLQQLLHLHCGINHGYVIGLYCQPSVNLPSWILGILQVGAAFCPIDPESSPRLSAYFIQRCKLKYILIQEDMIQKFRDSLSTWLYIEVEYDIPMLNVVLVKIQWQVANVDSLASEPRNEENVIYCKIAGLREGILEAAEKDNKKHAIKYADCLRHGFVAYILQTSGTTGTPKIVQVPHQCIVPNVQHLKSIFKVSSDDVIFMASPLTFDPSVVEMFVALCSGATLLIVPPIIKMMPKRLAKVLFEHHKVSVMQATPTLIKRFGSEVMTSLVLSANTSLRVLALGGEAFPSLCVLKSWRGEGNKTQIFNLYGITEVSSWATYYKIPEETLCSTTQLHAELVPLGFPLLGTILDVMDDSGQVIQEGEGQVFIGGKERVCFLDDEITVCPGTMRATGDWVIIKAGHMYYKGRRDNQIKRHGKRVSLESVQQVAEGLKQVETCAVTKYDQDKLVLFVVPRDIAELRKGGTTNFRRDILLELGKHLSSHAIPDDVVQINSLPFTTHGKVDRTTLIQTYQERTKTKNSNYMLGKKELWESIHQLWKVVLNLPEDLPDVSENCMFLYSGGDSLKALRLAEEIETLLGQTVFGLTEVILNCSLLDIYHHINNTIFCEAKNKEELDKNDRKMKRKRIKDETPGSQPKRIEQWQLTATFANVTTISRGSQITKLNSTVSYKNCGNSPDIAEGKELMDDEPNGKEKEENDSSNVSENMNASISFNDEKMPVKNSYWESFANKVVKPLHVDGKFIPEDLVVNCRTVSLKIRWKSDTAKCVDASPLVVISGDNGSDETVYIGSHSHRMQAIDVLSGKIKWERILGDRIESSACMSRCGNFIIVGCYDGSISVLRENDGETHWIFWTGNSVKSSPVMDPDLGLVFVGSHDQNIYALDILGKVCVWKLHCGGGAVFSTPCLNKSPRILYIATLGESLVAVNPDTGSVVWKRSCGKPLFSSPRCTSQSVYIGCVAGSLQCFSHNGDQLWQFSTGGPIFSSPCICNFAATDQKIICGSHDCFVYCLDEDGNLVWKFETSKQVYSVPFVFTNCDLDDRTLVAVISTDGNLWILAATTGELVASYSLPGEVFSSPVLWKKTLIVGCRNNYVYCLEMSALEQKNTDGLG